MKITICGSMAFASKMKDVKDILESQGHIIYAPTGIEHYPSEVPRHPVEETEKKIRHNLIKAHHDCIHASDAILVVNEAKGDQKNYVGGNTLLEMGFAYVLEKKIFLLNPIPETELINQEIVAMQPIILNGDLQSIQ